MALKRQDLETCCANQKNVTKLMRKYILETHSGNELLLNLPKGLKNSQLGQVSMTCLYKTGRKV